MTTQLEASLHPGTYLSGLLSSSIKTNQVEINTDIRTQKTVARLKEPRDLFTLPREPDCAQEAARWPAECQVVDMKMQLIENMPPYAEKYYDVTGKEVQPKPIGEEDGYVVFQYNPMSAVNYFGRSMSGGNLVSVSKSSSKDLKFESRFESGNLAKVIRVTDTYYELYLRNDLYTNKHTGWFYFMVENMKKNIAYRFSIVNLSKGESLYSVGMKPVMYSSTDALTKKIGWRRCGNSITYFRNDNGKVEDDPECTFTLTFTIDFPHEGDCVYLAHSYPYTYTDLQEYLTRLQNHPLKSMHTKLRLLCKSLAGNNVYYLTVTEPPMENEPLKKKKAVVITARVHPGETPSSFMMKGLIDFITGDTRAARELRGRFIFKLVPMLNPDGVIVGNTRCSLTGRDLNRQYRTVIRETYPPVWHTKVLIRRLMEDCGIALYCDLHAHSCKHNVFIYGCENKRNPDRRLQEQVFPLMLHKNSSDKFSFENCKFRVHKNKEGTGRVVMWMLGIENSYTLEASFAGTTLGVRSCTHFTTFDYESMGRSFCETLLDFLDEAPVKHIPVEIEIKDPDETPKRRIKRRRTRKRKIPLPKSHEDGLNDSSDDERKKREDYTLIAPPPSPILPHEKLKIQKESSPKSHRHPPPIIVYSPPVQRKTMQIPTTRLDLECGDLASSGDEKERSSAQPNRSELVQARSVVRVGRVDMPPELIVTSTQNNDLSVFERLYKSVQQPKGLEVSQSLPKGICPRCSPRRTRKDLSPMSDPELKSKGEDEFPFKQPFWRIFPNGHLSLESPNSIQEQLKACSEKLIELKKRHKLKKIKHAANYIPPKILLVNMRVKRRSKSLRIESSSQISENTEERLKTKSLITIQKIEDNLIKKPTGKTKKFRKGGFVSLATVNTNLQDNFSVDETTDGTSKKKKKKKKLNQLQKRVKNAVNAVSAVTVTAKVKRETFKKKSYDS